MHGSEQPHSTNSDKKPAAVTLLCAAELGESRPPRGWPGLPPERGTAVDRDTVMATLRDVEQRSRQRQAKKAEAKRQAAAEHQRQIHDQAARRPLQKPPTPAPTIAERIYYGRR